jgi:M6 family metalloprotease-like protein
MSGQPPRLADFGHNSILQGGAPAAGSRPLLIVLAEYDADDTGRFSPFSDVHPLDYYERLGFGQPTPPFSTANPINPASLSAFFNENSGGRFTIRRGALVGPLPMGAFYTTDPGPETRLRDILQRAEELVPDVFFSADSDADGQIEFNEMLVVTVENFLHGWPANRDNLPFTITRQTPGGSVTKTVTLHVAGTSLLTPFFQIAHELSHSLGTVDMYNNGAGNYQLTLMSGYSFEANDQVPVHLDAWHKVALGWCEPTVRRLDQAGTQFLPEIGTGLAASPVLLWHPDRGAREYFLVERRTSQAADARYDRGFGGNGVLIWRVVQGVPAPATHLGAPNLSSGGSGVWGADQVTPPLLWSDGTPTGFHIAVRPSGTGLRIDWSATSVDIGPPDNFKILFYGGNGTTPVDSGMPRVGEIYGVKPEGPLLWYKYLGSGEPDSPATAHANWDSNSGNTIGRGWNGLQHLFPRGDGVIFAVHPNGNLLYYRYDGDGTSDPNATGLNWDPNSGNTIGTGWANFRFLCSKPYEGRTSTHRHNSVIYAVGRDGFLRWYRYFGDGESDPDATGLNWDPNSGNIIGQGWSDGFRYMAAISDIILMVKENGDLLWYRYFGKGETDPSGGSGWDPKSSNIIGSGWHRFRHIFGGSDGRGGYVIYAVDHARNLRWHRYSGTGDSDPTSTSSAWSPNSGNVIGTGW